MRNSNQDNYLYKPTLFSLIKLFFQDTFYPLCPLVYPRKHFTLRLRFFFQFGDSGIHKNSMINSHKCRVSWIAHNITNSTLVWHVPSCHAHSNPIFNQNESSPSNLVLKNLLFSIQCTVFTLTSTKSSNVRPICIKKFWWIPRNRQ